METKKKALHRVKFYNKKDYNIVYNFSIVWVKTQYKVFSADNLKKAFLDKNEMPLQVNVFGSVFHNLAKSNLIFKQGAINSVTPKSKGRLINTWISRELKERQQSNAKTKGTLNMFAE